MDKVSKGCWPAWAHDVGGSHTFLSHGVEWGLLSVRAALRGPLLVTHSSSSLFLEAPFQIVGGPCQWLICRGLSGGRSAP